MLNFKRFQAIPLSKTPAKVLVRWEVDLTGAELADYEFFVDRGGAEDAKPGFQHVDIQGRPIEDGAVHTQTRNLEAISVGIPALDSHWFLDFSASLRGLAINPWYRVRARKISTQEEVATPVFTFEGELDVVGLYVVDEHNFLLEDVVGVPCLVYNRRRGGVPCGRCFDPVQKKRLISNCKLCYGTNWAGGFYSPIDTYINLDPDPKAFSVQQWGESQDQQTNLMMSNFPSVLPGDVIRELRTGRMWRLVSVAETEKRRVPMLQMLRAVEIRPGDVEYSLPADERLVIKKIQELEATKQKREF